MKFKSLVLAQASGSTGGLVYSHNKGGMYVRSRSTPINPATPQQQAVRASLKLLTTRWQNVLTPAQRAAWAIYATNVPLVNKLGEPHAIPALSMYVRCNSPRLTTGGITNIVDDGPTAYALATFPVPVPTLTSVHLSLAFDNTADWAIADGGYLFVYMSRPQSPTIVFFKGPFQNAATVAGATAVPPTSPFVKTAINLPFPSTTGLTYFFRFNVSNADGRLSSSFIVPVICG